jgi:hypothetical protein
MAGLTGVTLDVELEVDGEASWWRDTRLLAQILAALERRGLWFDFGYVGEQGAPLEPFASTAEVLGASTEWLDRIYVLHSHGEGGLERAFQGSYVSFSLEASKLRLQLKAAPPALDTRRDSLVESMVGCLCDLQDALGSSGRVGPTAFVHQSGLRHPWVRPPRLDEPFQLGHLVDAFDPAYFAKHPRYQEAVEKLLVAPIPAGCERTEHHGLVLFRSVRDLRDEAEVVSGCARQERFFIDVINPPIVPAFNEAGDLRVIGIRARLDPHPPLTAYDEDRQTGYKALLADEAGGVEADEWARLAGWARAGQLPDGSPLKALRVIVPYRSAALALHARAVAEGIDCVLYPDDKGVWWDPSPPGPWQN